MADSTMHIVDVPTLQWIAAQNEALAKLKGAAGKYYDYYNVNGDNFSGSVFKGNDNEYAESILGNFCGIHIDVANDIVHIVQRMEALLSQFNDYCQKVIQQDHITSQDILATAKSIGTIDIGSPIGS